MPTPPQANNFGETLVYLCDTLATSLGISANAVAIVEKPNDNHLTFSGQMRLLVQVSNPIPHNPNFGAGRVFPVARVLTIHVCTRTNTDRPGTDRFAVVENISKQDDVINALQLIPTAGRLVVPPKLIGSDPTIRYEESVGVHIGQLNFEVQYILPINPAVAGGSRA